MVLLNDQATQCLKDGIQPVPGKHIWKRDSQNKDLLWYLYFNCMSLVEYQLFIISPKKIKFQKDPVRMNYSQDSF